MIRYLALSCTSLLIPQLPRVCLAVMPVRSTFARGHVSKAMIVTRTLGFA